VEVELKKKGHKAPKEVFKKYKSLLKKKEKKNHHSDVRMQAYFLDSPNISFDEYENLILTHKS